MPPPAPPKRRSAVWNRDRSVASLAGRWARPPSQFVDVDGLSVHVRDEGDASKPAIVLVHGTGNSLHTWDGWADRLGDAYRVVRFDRPGFGLTGPVADGDYSMDAYVRFMRRFLDVMHVDRAAVVGSSAGGAVAWHLAVAEPARVERLVLIGSAGYPRTTKAPLGFRLAMSPLGPVLLRLASRKAVAASVRLAYGDPSRVSEETIDRSFELMMRAGNRDVFGATLRALYRSMGARSIASVSVPTLIVWGSKDAVVPPSDARRFAGDIAGSECVVLEGLGHLPHEEDPGATVAVVRRFLDATRAATPR